MILGNQSQWDGMGPLRKLERSDYLSSVCLCVPLQTQRVDFAMGFAVQFGIELFRNGNTEDFHGKLSVSYRR